jgi:titin
MRRLVSWLRRLSRPTRPVRTGPPSVSRPLFVEALEDRLLPTAYVVTTTKDILGDTTPGEVTLRDALTALDGTPSGNATAAGTAANSITFAVLGTGPQTIAVGSDPSARNQALPAISRQVFLDGWSQGGSGYQGPPLIVLNGASAGSSATGLVLNAGSGGSTIRGLVIQRFDGDGIDVNGTSGNLVAGNYLGSDASGMTPLGNGGDGILIHQGATANTVGGTTPGAGNLISEGAGASGIEITDAGTSGNVVLGNLIGTDITGKARLADTGALVRGVFIHGGATGNTVGGTASGAGNLISGNCTGGDFPFGGGGRQVVISGPGTSGNVVLGNLIGTDITGAANLGKYVEGVVIEGGATGNTIGGTAAGAGNVISGNSNGIEIMDVGTSGNVVQGNLIGTDKTGTRALGNSNQGVHIADASANIIGGTAPGAGNVISGNTFVEDAIGLEILGNSATGNLVQGNRIGTDITGTVILHNNYDGVHIGDASGNTVGGTAPGAANLISGNGPGVELSGPGASGNVVLGNLIGTDIAGIAKLGNDEGILIRFNATANTIGGTAPGSGNLISGNGRAGVHFAYGAADNVVLGNLIGTDITGTRALGNGGGGVNIDSGAGNIIGGAVAGAGNVISANGSGISISGSGTSGNVMQGNLIGTDITGTQALGNSTGLYLFSDSSANTIGGTAAGAGNVISANAGDGIEILGGAHSYVVQGNLIGTDITGSRALGNGGHGIIIGESNNIVGGAAPGAGNVISANGGDGVVISAINATGNLVAGNFIGTDKTGTAALGNSGDGVRLAGGAAGNTVGGTGPHAGNVISGNSYGVGLSDSGTSGNAVFGNRIGTDGRGSANLGNTNDGVILEGGATGDAIGGTTPGNGNTIAFNGKGVVLVDDTASGEPILGDSILGNRIWGNTGPGIDINDDGPTPNGPNPRALPNDGQNTPVITGLTPHSVSGRLRGVPRTRFRIEFFATAAGDTANQGQTFLGFLTVATNAAGVVFFTAPLAAVPLGTAVTATATNLSTGDTSEFSPVGTQFLFLSDPRIVFSLGAQAVTLSVQVFFGNAPVTSGLVVFRVAGVPGTAVGRVNAKGVATATFVVPAGTLPGSYVITATYRGTEGVPPAVGVGLLTITEPFRAPGRGF